MIPLGTGTAVTREVTWLATALVKTSPHDSTAPFDSVQAYWEQSPDDRQRSVYVLRPRLQVVQETMRRVIPRYTMRVSAQWPLLDPGGSAQTDQLAFDAAIELLVERIVGDPFDRTHGGAFRSVGGVTPGQPIVTVDFAAPELAVAQGSPLVCTLTYQIDDLEVSA